MGGGHRSTTEWRCSCRLRFQHFDGSGTSNIAAFATKAAFLLVS